MKAIIALLLATSPAAACDWTLSREVDRMTDVSTCLVRSESAKVTFYRHGSDRLPNVRTSSAYVRSGESLAIRVDDNPAVQMGNNAYQRQKALNDLLPQLNSGTRIRTSFRDVPAQQEGEAEVCNLVELLASC